MFSFRRVMQQIVLIPAALAFAATAWAQGCNQYPVQGVPPCSPNPVPCAHCTGTWTDSTYGTSWTINSNANPPAPGSYPISGTVTIPSVPGCPSATWSITGTITQTQGTFGSTAITWNGANPDPDVECGGQSPASGLTFSGYISNDGCDYAFGTFDDTGGHNEQMTLQKPADVPDGNPAQTSSAICWWDQCGSPSNWTVVLFEDAIQSSKAMAGRQTYEWQDYPNNVYDDCWYQDSAYVSGGGALTAVGGLLVTIILGIEWTTIMSACFRV